MAEINGDGKNNRLKGGVDDDQIFGYGGKDNIDGGAGNDYLSGGLDDDKLGGGAGDDSIFGDEGNDNIDGDSGDDFLIGGTGNDDLDGGAGNDYLFGAWNTFNYEHDRLNGGAGDDSFVGSVNTEIDGGSGFDTMFLDYSGLNHALNIDYAMLSSGHWLNVEGGRVRNVEAITFLQATYYDDTVRFGDTQANNVYLLAGNDDAFGSSLSDSIYGGRRKRYDRRKDGRRSPHGRHGG